MMVDRIVGVTCGLGIVLGAVLAALDLRTLGDPSRIVLVAGLLCAVAAAAGVAVLVTWREGTRAHGRRLAVGMWGVSAWFLLSVAPLILGPDAGWTLRVHDLPLRDFLGLLGLATGLLATARFAHAFPREVSVEMLDAGEGVGRVGGKLVRVPSALRPLLAEVGGGATEARLLVRALWSPAAWMAVVGVSALAALGPWGTVAGTGIAIALGCVAVVVGTGANYATASVAERGRILWVSLGLGAGLPILGLAALGMQTTFTTAEVLLDIGGGAEDLSAFVFRWPVAAVLLGAAWFSLGCVVVGLFFFGALDSRLAIRRTVVTGTAGLCAAFLFGVVEAALSDVVLTGLGVPDGASAWIAGGLAAVTFGPVRAVLDRRLGRHLARRLGGASGEGAAP